MVETKNQEIIGTSSTGSLPSLNAEMNKNQQLPTANQSLGNNSPKTSLLCLIKLAEIRNQRRNACNRLKFIVVQLNERKLQELMYKRRNSVFMISPVRTPFVCIEKHKQLRFAFTGMTDSILYKMIKNPAYLNLTDPESNKFKEAVNEIKTKILDNNQNRFLSFFRAGYHIDGACETIGEKKYDYLTPVQFAIIEKNILALTALIEYMADNMKIPVEVEEKEPVDDEPKFEEEEDNIILINSDDEEIEKTKVPDNKINNQNIKNNKEKKFVTKIDPEIFRARKENIVTDSHIGLAMMCKSDQCFNFLLNFLKAHKDEIADTIGYKPADSYADLPDLHGRTPLYIAIKTNNIEKIQVLINEHSANIFYIYPLVDKMYKKPLFPFQKLVYKGKEQYDNVMEILYPKDQNNRVEKLKNGILRSKVNNRTRYPTMAPNGMELIKHLVDNFKTIDPDVFDYQNFDEERDPAESFKGN